MKVFYYDAYLDEGIDSDNCKIVTLDEAIDYFYGLTDEIGSFIGFVDSNENVIQFAWEREDIWLVDIPKVEYSFAFQKEASYEEIVEIIRIVFKENKIVEFPGMTKFYF